MMAVRAPLPISLNPSASSPTFMSDLQYPRRASLPSMASQGSQVSTTDRRSQLSDSSVTLSKTPLKDDLSEPIPFETRAEDAENTVEGHKRILDHGLDEDHEPRPTDSNKLGLVSPDRSGPLKIDTEKSVSYDSTVGREDEPPLSVIHAPLGFGKFSQHQPTRLRQFEDSSATTPKPAIGAVRMGSITGVSRASSESAASDVTVTRIVGDTAEPVEKPTLIPPLQTQIPMAPEWNRTPRAQTRKDLGVFSRPGSSLSSLASISEAEDDHPDFPTDYSADEIDHNDPPPPFYRNTHDEFGTLQTALTECWTLCNTLANLSYIHREKIFSKKGNMQQQAWRSCWKLCQNLYEARSEASPMNVRLTLDLCREFCQAVFDVRARDNEPADSVLRVSFELNNHLFNTHDRSLPEAFSERTLDFYITLCHRLMKQRSSSIEETGSLLRSCWSLAEMLFSIRQTRRDGRAPDEELLGSAIQACWELCDLFRDGWSQIRPERQTPRPAQTTLTQAFQQARRVYSRTSGTEQPQIKLLPETPTTIFEDVTGESPFEANAPHILVLGPEESNPPTSASSLNPPSSSQLHSRQSGYHWPSLESTSSITTLSTTSSNSLENSIRTIRSPSDDPNMALLKSLFVRAAMNTNRGFSPLASTNITNVSSLTSLPLFVKSLPEVAFGSSAWQMSLLDNYRKAIANDSTFRALGVAANPTLLGLDGDDATKIRIRADTAYAVDSVVNGTFGWTWLKDLFRYAFGVYVEDILSDEKR